jgi:putative spermidine/putrescine transport system permease protein
MASGASRPKPSSRFSWDWLGVVPFFAFAILFLFLPSLVLFVGSFQDAKGNFTLANITGLFTPSILSAYWVTIRISVVTALGGGVLGFLVAYAGVISGLPRWVRTAMMTFSGVASNFAGVPLAFAFISTLGRLGLVTVFLRDVLHINIYDAGFSLYSFAGLSLTYMYF